VAHPYTLLIVESPTIAKGIEHLNLPGVEVIATKGFVWMPTFNRKSGNIKKLADPLKKALRKELSEKSLWASRIIIAADSDPSGLFITDSIHQFLKEKALFVTHIDVIDEEHIHQKIENVSPLTGNEGELLTRYFCVWEFISKTMLSHVSLEELLAFSIFNSEQNFHHWGNSNGSNFISNDAVKATFDSTVQVKSARFLTYVHPPAPPSISDILNPESGSFQAGYETLRMLFETLPEEVNHSLISYPRTSNQTWHKETWQTLSNQLTHQSDVLNLVPNGLWKITDRNQREGIHVHNLRLRPTKARPFLTMNAWKLYERIYKRTLSSLCVDTRSYPAYRSIENSKDVFISLDELPSDEIILKPKLKQAHFMQLLLNSGFIKPSKIGGIMDKLLNKGCIRIEDELVFPEINFLNKSLLQNVKIDYVRFFAQLHTMTLNPDYPIERIFENIREHNYA